MVRKVRWTSEKGGEGDGDGGRAVEDADNRDSTNTTEA
jgi:hypothetical protein